MSEYLKSVFLPIITGFVLDIIFGDNQRFPHIVRVMGNVISFWEKRIYAIGTSKESKFISGAALSIFVIGLFFFASHALINIFEAISSILAFIIRSFFCFQLLAAKCLKDEAMAIYQKLFVGDINGARYRLSMIVGRDTQNLSEEKIIMATVETVSENTCDGVIAPLFYMFIGGAPLGILYKIINTLDSMIGYNNERYAYFGKFAARLDDAANFIPARLTGIFMILVGFFQKGDFNVKSGIKIFLRDRKNHKSPNSGHSEAACAGLLGIYLGGGGYYGGKYIEKPYIGHRQNLIAPQHIILSIKLMYFSAYIGLTAFGIIGFLAH